MEARDERRLLRLPLQLSRLGLLIVEVFSQRCERGSILVTPTSLSTSGPACSDRRGHLRWPPDMNSARRTGRLSHPASAAAFPFSPGGARRPFLFFSLFLFLPPPGALPVSGPAGRGLSEPGLSPRAGGSARAVSGAVSNAAGGAARGPSGPPARRLHAPLPAPAGGGGFAGFSGGDAVFRGLSAIFRGPPAVLPGPFAPFSGISPVLPPKPRTGFLPLPCLLHASEAAGASSASLAARRGRFPLGPGRSSPTACPAVFAPFFWPYI